MKKLLELISEEMGAAFEAAGYKKELGRVTVSNRPDLCQFQCNGAMAAAKEYHKAPFMIGDEIVAKLAGNPAFKSIECVKPGFINIILSAEFIGDYVRKMAESDKLFRGACQ